MFKLLLLLLILLSVQALCALTVWREFDRTRNHPMQCKRAAASAELLNHISSFLPSRCRSRLSIASSLHHIALHRSASYCALATSVATAATSPRSGRARLKLFRAIAAPGEALSADAVGLVARCLRAAGVYAWMLRREAARALADGAAGEEGYRHLDLLTDDVYAKKMETEYRNDLLPDGDMHWSAAWSHYGRYRSASGYKKYCLLDLEMDSAWSVGERAWYPFGNRLPATFNAQFSSRADCSLIISEFVNDGRHWR